MEKSALEENENPDVDRAVYFGDGCYDATTFANNNIFAADDHLDRFTTAASCWKSRLKCRAKNCVPSCRNASMPMRVDHGMLYWQCSRGTTYRDISFHLLP